MNGKHTKEPPTLKSVLANKVLRPAATFVLLPLALFILLGAMPAEADINPWIAATQYDPRKWDTAGPYTATPWLHPPPPGRPIRDGGCFLDTGEPKHGTLGVYTLAQQMLYAEDSKHRESLSAFAALSYAP